MVTGVLYASTSLPAEPGFERLDEAVKGLLNNIVPATVPAEGSALATTAPIPPTVLWKLQYQQTSLGVSTSPGSNVNDRVIVLPSMPSDLVFDDTVLESVKGAWRQIVGEGASDEEFLVFDARDGSGMDMGDDDE